jgi:hypothetical protein
MKKKQRKDPRPKWIGQPRPLAWVKIDPSMEAKYIDHYKQKFGRTDFLIYMGEIPNQLGHCIIFTQDDGKMHVGYHIENFVEMTDDET